MFVFFMLYENILIPLIIVLACLIAAAVVLLVLRAKRKKGGEAGKKSAKKVLVEGIQQNIGEFGEMFEPVYSVSVGKNKKQEETFAEWNVRVKASPEDNGYKALFEKKYGGYADWGRGKKKVKVKKANKIYKKKAKSLVKLFFKGNILRGGEVYETGCETTAENYVYVGYDDVIAGAMHEVHTPS